MKKDILTLEAKEAIRSYILNLVTIPGIALTLISFFLGYFIRDIAVGKAEIEAWTDLSDDVYAVVREVNAVKRQAKEILKDAEDTKIQLGALVEDPDAVKNALKVLTDFEGAERLASDISELRTELTNDYVKFGEKINIHSTRHPGYMIHTYTNPNRNPNLDIENEGPSGVWYKWELQRAPE